MNKYNSQYFSKEDVENGTFTKFLKVLMDACYGKGTSYNDIHIKPEDLGAFTIDWVQSDWKDSYDYPSYQLIDIDQVIMKEVYLPDNSIQYAIDDEQEKDVWEEWTKDHKNWYKNSYGMWCEDYKTKNN